MFFWSRISCSWPRVLLKRLVPWLIRVSSITQIMCGALGVLTDQLAWMPSALKTGVIKKAVYESGVLTVSVTLPTTALAAITPVLHLPGNITVPHLPATLSAQSSLQF